jgi:hypothetical protein
MGERHWDSSEVARDALAHPGAAAFPLQQAGDSWVGALCPQHMSQMQARFGAGLYAVQCAHPACRATCAVCQRECAPRAGGGGRSDGP